VFSRVARTLRAFGAGVLRELRIRWQG
jgi:hypothetical protein